jgi:sugar lactone lactonase YvrE
MFENVVRLRAYCRAFFIFPIGVGALLAAGCGGEAPSAGPAGIPGVAAEAQMESLITSRPTVSASSAPQVMLGARLPGWLSPSASGKPLIYAATRDAVAIFQDGPKPPVEVGSITSGVSSPYGLLVDASGRLFVANRTNSTVTEYASGTTTPQTTYQQDLDSPLYVAEDAAGDVYVSNAYGSSITVYASGSTTATTLPSLGSETDGLAFDASGTLYAAYRNGISGGIEVFATGATSPTDLGINLNQPQGLVVDAAGNIVAVETGGTNTVDFFPPGSTTPSQQIGIPETPTQVALTAKDTAFFVSTLAGKIYELALSVENPRTKIRHLASLQGTALYPAFQSPGTYLKRRP